MPPRQAPGSKVGTSKYLSKRADANGYIHYSDQENRVWHDLITRQIPMLPERACKPWIDAMNEMNFPRDVIPQLKDVSSKLRKHTGWSVSAVPALIGFTEFFKLLAGKSFPVATFIRTRKDFDYIQEPDVFHEVFGHTPALTDHRFAAFVEAYGNAGINASPADQCMLARLFWFTVEFGLVNTAEGVRAYGSGIMSSPGELLYSIGAPEVRNAPELKPFDPIEVLRTPYRIDILQPIYFVIDSFDELFDLAQADLLGLVNQARRLGQRAPTYPPKVAA